MENKFVQAPLDGFSLLPSPCKKIIDKQGKQAVTSGDRTEAVIYCIIKELGYPIHRQYVLDTLSIHGGKIKVDFFVEGIKQFPNGLIIESR